MAITVTKPDDEYIIASEPFTFEITGIVDNSNMSIGDFKEIDDLTIANFDTINGLNFTILSQDIQTDKITITANAITSERYTTKAIIFKEDSIKKTSKEEPIITTSIEHKGQRNPVDITKFIDIFISPTFEMVESDQQAFNLEQLFINPLEGIEPLIIDNVADPDPNTNVSVRYPSNRIVVVDTTEAADYRIEIKARHHDDGKSSTDEPKTKILLRVNSSDANIL